MQRLLALLGGLAAVCALGLPVAAPAAAQAIQLAEEVRPLVSGERVKVQRLARDIESAMQTLDQGGLAPFQDSGYVQRWQDKAAQFETALQRYPQVDDPDVQTAATRLGEFKNMLAFGIAESAKQDEDLGDVQAILAGIEEKLSNNRAPQWLPAPFDDAEARAWVQTAADAQVTAKEAAAELERIAPLAHLPDNPGTVQQGAPYDRKDLDRLYRFAQETLAEVDAAVAETVAALQTRFEAQDRELAYYRELDPDNQQHRANAFLREGAAAEIYGELDRQLAVAESVAAYQRAFGQEPSAAATGRIEEIHALRQGYADNRKQALGDSRLPDAQSEDEARLAIAEEILAEPSYGFGTHGPIVLTTAEIVEREKTVSRAEIKDVDVSLSGEITLSGTETTWNYAWQEFKFATPLKEENSGDWYIWWVTAKNYSSGWEKTPIGEWVSGAATKGDLILEENFSE